MQKVNFILYPTQIFKTYHTLQPKEWLAKIHSELFRRCRHTLRLCWFWSKKIVFSLKTSQVSVTSLLFSINTLNNFAMHSHPPSHSGPIFSFWCMCASNLKDMNLSYFEANIMYFSMAHLTEKTHTHVCNVKEFVTYKIVISYGLARCMCMYASTCWIQIRSRWVRTYMNSKTW